MVALDAKARSSPWCVCRTPSLSAPAVCSADFLSDVQDLASRNLTPAPLVPTAVPRSLEPLDRTLTSSPSRRRSGYALRMVHYGGDGPDAIIVLERDALKTVSAALRDARRLGFKARRTSVRGHPGYLLTRHLGPTQWTLLWVEDGRIYTLGTGTPRKVSLKQLRATAAGLEHLGRGYLGTHADPENSSEGQAVTTDHTVSLRVSWEAQCVMPDGSPAGIRVGQAQVSVLRRRGRLQLRHSAEPAGDGRLERHRDGDDLGRRDHAQHPGDRQHRRRALRHRRALNRARPGLSAPHRRALSARAGHRRAGRTS